MLLPYKGKEGQDNASGHGRSTLTASQMAKKPNSRASVALILIFTSLEIHGKHLSGLQSLLLLLRIPALQRLQANIETLGDLIKGIPFAHLVINN